LVPLVLPQTAKKVLKSCRAVLGEHPTRDWQPVIQTRIVAELIQRFHRTAFGIKTAKNKPPDPCLHNGSHTHDARFQGHVKLAIRQTPTTKMPRRLFDSQQFCMCEGATQLLPPIVASPNYFAFANDNGTHRHLTPGCGFVCLIQR
jgi:hypothetical protein